MNRKVIEGIFKLIEDDTEPDDRKFIVSVAFGKGTKFTGMMGKGSTRAEALGNFMIQLWGLRDEQQDQ